MHKHCCSKLKSGEQTCLSLRAGKYILSRSRYLFCFNALQYPSNYVIRRNPIAKSLSRYIREISNVTLSSNVVPSIRNSCYWAANAVAIKRNKIIKKPQAVLLLPVMHHSHYIDYENPAERLEASLLFFLQLTRKIHA